MCFTRNQFLDTTSVTRIEVDDKFGLAIGLTSDVFIPASQCSDAYPYGTQLFRNGDSIYIQAIEVRMSERKKHHFDRLLETLWNLGFTIKVPNPVSLMYKILKNKEFLEISEQDPTSLTFCLQVVMVKLPPSKASCPSETV